jgi:hypothetical protein
VRGIPSVRTVPRRPTSTALSVQLRSRPSVGAGVRVGGAERLGYVAGRTGGGHAEARNINLDMSVYKTVKRAPRPPAALVAQDDVSCNDGNESYKVSACYTSSR